MTKEEVRRLRRKVGLTQYVFWTQLGITQSGGSRYEVGSRRIPKHVALLLELAYGAKPLRVLERLRRAPKKATKRKLAQKR
jgi:DNA-binding transcriptional regulator YiaG